MPRSITGVYTVPAGINPVVAGTTILDTWANPTLADVAQGITDSLDRSGRGSMLAQLKLVDGTAGTPGLGFANEPSTGLYRIGAGQIGFSIATSLMMTLSSVGLGIGTAPVSGFSLAAAQGVFSGVLKVAGNSGLAAAAAGGLILDYASSISRAYIGDGSGYDLRLSKRTGSVTTDLVYFSDSGNTGFGRVPAAKVDILGSLIRISNGQPSVTEFRFGPTSASGDYAQILWDNTAGSQKMRFNPDAGAIIGSIGNVEIWRTTTTGFGVFTTTPDAAIGADCNGAVRIAFKAHYQRNTYADIFGSITHQGDSGGLEIANVNSSVNRSINFKNGTSYASLTNRFTIDSVGRIGGFALHNNASSPTGTSTQYIASGTYTPTLTNVTNIASSTASPCQWIRVGNVVTVSGLVTFTANTTGSPIELGISLPIPSNLTVASNCAGVGSQEQYGNVAVVISGDTVNDRASLRTFWAVNSPVDHFFTFTYTVL